MATTKSVARKKSVSSSAGKGVPRKGAPKKAAPKKAAATKKAPAPKATRESPPPGRKAPVKKARPKAGAKKKSGLGHVVEAFKSAASKAAVYSDDMLDKLRGKGKKKTTFEG